MKVAESSENRLVVRHVPWLLGGFMWLMGGAALYAAIFRAGSFASLGEAILVPLLGVAMLAGGWWFAPVVTLDFDRTANRLTFREARLLRLSVRVIDLSKIECVQLQSNWSDGARLTRLALRTADGVTPLETGYSSADRAKVASVINAWLEGEAASQHRQPTVRR